MNKTERELIDKLIAYYEVDYQDIHAPNRMTPGKCCRNLALTFVRELKLLKGGEWKKMKEVWKEGEFKKAMEDNRIVLFYVGILGNGNLWLEKDLDLLQ